MDVLKINFHLHDLVIAMFQGGEAEEKQLEAAEQEHRRIYTNLFDDVMSGRIDAFSIYTRGDSQNGNRQIYHRSPKQAGYMQISYIWYRNGEMIPTMDEQVNTAADMICKAAPDNVTITTFKNRKEKQNGLQ